MSDSLWPQGLGHARLPCLALFPRVCSISCPLSQWLHPTTSSSTALFSFCFQSKWHDRNYCKGISSVQFSHSVVSDSLWPRESQHAITNYRSLFKLMSIELVMPSIHLILCRPLLLLLPMPPSIRVFPNESTLRMRWPKYWSFCFSISPSNEHPGLISFRMGWLDLLAVQS